MTMRYTILLLATLLTAPMTAPATAAPADGPPNIVVILVDDLGYGDLSSYGATDLKTPHIDQLVSRGMKFKSAYANCPVCSPTRAALLSGSFPDLVGVPGVIRTHEESNWGYLQPRGPLLPQALKPAGYHTAIIGKWHLGLSSPNVPNERGFDHFHGFLGDMMDDYYNHRRHGNNYMRLNREEIQPQGHATDLFTDWACEYISQRAEADQPYFLYLAYNAPHTPIQPPEDWLKKVRERNPDLPMRRAKLVALIEHLDHGIGQVAEAIEKSGEAENTLLIFTSDNGGQSSVGANNGPWRSGKGEMYEGGLRVPMCAVWPQKITAGSTTERVTLSMDIYPTVCDAAGVKVEHTISGVSFLPTLRGEQPTQPNRTLAWVRREGGGYGGHDWYAIRQGDWKLLQRDPYSPYELYNLADDPQEQTNLANENRQQATRLRSALSRHMQQAGQIPWQAPAESAAE